MKYLAPAAATLALSLVIAACGSDHKIETKPSSTSSTSTSASSAATSPPATSATPGAQTHKTIADYIAENHITETPVHRGDPGSPTINLPLPDGWTKSDSSGASYGTIVLSQPANPADPPTISALVAKLSGDVDPAKVIEYAPGELQNLPGYDGPNTGSASTLGGFQAWQLGGNYMKNGGKRAVAQKTVVIPGQGAVFVLQLNADSLDADVMKLMDAASVIDDKTTITP